jgi:hypothetical protein
VIPSPPEWRAVIDEYRSGDEQRLVAHINFVKFTPSVYRNYKAWWKLFRLVVKAPLFASGRTDDPKFERWCRLSGFVPFREAACNDGSTRRIFIHTIQDHPSAGQSPNSK